MRANFQSRSAPLAYAVRSPPSGPATPSLVVDPVASSRPSVLMLTSTLNALSVFPLQLEMSFVAFPSSARHWAPPSWTGMPGEPLTAIEQLCHVRDIEIDGYQLRLERTLTEVRPLLPAIDSQALAATRGYGLAHPDAVLGEFRRARARTLQLIAGLDEAQLQRSAELAGLGPVTLRSLVHLLCSHDQQHLAGLQWLLAQYSARHLHASPRAVSSTAVPRSPALIFNRPMIP